MTKEQKMTVDKFIKMTDSEKGLFLQIVTVAVGRPDLRNFILNEYTGDLNQLPDVLASMV